MENVFQSSVDKKKQSEATIDTNVRKSQIDTRKAAVARNSQVLQNVSKTLAPIIALQLTNTLIQVANQNGKLQELVNNTNKIIDGAKAVAHFVNAAKEIKSPKFQKHPVETFTKEELEKIMKACVYMREAQTETRKKFTMRRPSAHRDQAIVLVLLDTGLRATELCSLIVNDVDLKTGKVTVRHGVAGGAKGGKGRTVYLGKVARKAVWRYLASREDGDDPKAPLFISHADRPFNKDSLRVLINRLGERAEVQKTYPHKFRHTFAITYLRSGGDVFTLQSLLGHGTLDMVRHYAQIAEVDVEQAHRKASPADNMHL